MSKLKSVLIGIGTAVMGLLMMLFGAQKKKSKRLKEELDEQKAINRIKQTQMETVVQIQKELKNIETETAPDTVPSPDPGDVDDRLMRLNSLHNK